LKSEVEIRKELENRGHDPHKIDEWLKCDHEFNIKAYILSIDSSIPLEADVEREPQKPITSFETVCRFCHIREMLWKEVFIKENEA